MPIVDISTDQVTTVLIGSSGDTWLLPWNVGIQVLDGHGIHEQAGAADNRIVVDGQVRAVGDNTGVMSQSANADIRVGKTGVIFGDYGIHVENEASAGFVSNAGRIESQTIGIAMDASRATVRNTGTIEGGSAGIYFFSGDSESNDVFNSGSIRATIGIMISAPESVIRLTESSRILADTYAMLLAPGGEVHVDNAGVIRAPAALGAGGGNDSFINRGTVNGGIHLSGGDDLFRSIGGQVRGSINGGGGDDTYHIDFSEADINEIGGQGTDRVFSRADFQLTSNHMEVLRLVGRKNIDATGAGGGEALSGNAGRNELNGLGGSDTLTGGGGRDMFVFSTGGGPDTITDFRQGQDRIRIEGYATFLDFGDLIFVKQGSAVRIDFSGEVAGDGVLVEKAAIKDFDSGDFLFG